MSIQQSVWNYFLNKGFTPQGIAGMMGNIQIESQFLTNNVENGKLPYTDAQYTAMVDNGSYTKFVNDGCGYGLVQWTYSVFKQDLLNLCKSRGKSISDLSCQLDQLYLHLQSEKVLNTIKNAISIDEATIYFMTKFEKPSEEAQRKTKDDRIKYAKEFYKQFNTGKGGNGMKYSTNNAPLICMQTNSTCYKGTSKMQVKGVLWHSTGANNTTIKRYVQPSDNDPNKATLLAKIGKNTGGNDWNHISMQAGLNAWIGTLADGSITTVQTMPWDYKPWGCGSGSRGSCNNGWIQFEICEDALNNKTYFEKVYKEACELTAYLCKLYNLNPKGSVSFGGVTVPVILCHQDSAQLGLGSNHADVYHWFTKYGKTMVDVRNDVAALMGSSSAIISQPVSTTQTTITTTTTVATTRDLGRGDQGEDVKQLQKKLIKLGYNLGTYGPDKDGADGDFGKLTQQAVLDFQKKNKLQQDGVVGKLTMSAIDKALGEKTTTTSSKPTTTTSTTTTIIATDDVYRIRLNWTDAKSQIGAFKNLENAINTCKKAGTNYKVFNSAGQVVYPTSTNQQTTTTPIQNNTTSTTNDTTPVVQATKYSTVMIGSSSKDERGQYRGGQAGDQTGKEVWILNWYDGGWNYVVRPNSNALAEKIAVACEKGCNNSNIGYDQYERNSLYIEAKKVGLDLAKITTPCECDCSSFVSICCICAGLSPDIFYAGQNMRTTGNLVQACQKTNEFTVLSTNNYTKSKDYLKRGDILVSDGHTVIVLENGSNAGQIAPTVTVASTYKVKVTAEKKLNVRSGPSTKYAIITQVVNGGIFTIVEEKEGWGKLKSGAGWIDLSYTERI